MLKKAKKVFLLLLNNKLKLSLAMLCDLLFLVAFLVTFALIQIQLWQHIEVLFNIASQSLGQISTASVGMEAFVRQPEFAYQLTQALKWIMIEVLAAYLVFALFQGLSWSLAMKMLDRKTKFWLYLGKFSALTFIWFGLLTLLTYLWVRLSVYATFTIFPIINQGFITVIFVLLCLKLSFFAVLSFVLVKNTDLSKIFQLTFSTAFKKFQKTILAYILVLFVLLLIVTILILLAIWQQFILLLIFLIIVVLPALTFLRLFYTLCVLKKN